MCLPAEELTLAGFAQDGRADTMAPGALLATLLDAVAGEGGSGLAALADDQLIGVISAARRMESRTAWTLMAALAELARRRPAAGDAGDRGRYGFSEFAPDEVAFELRLSVPSAAGQMMYAVAVAGRLPASFAALAAGQIHPVHLRIIEDETRILPPELAAQADEILAGKAQTATFGELRYAARRLVLKLDPDAARRRKETAAKREAEIRRFREDSGNAGMIARELPCDEVLASWQHVDQRAHDLRAAGMPGSLRELRIRAYLDLLQERDSRPAPGNPSRTPDRPSSRTGRRRPARRQRRTRRTARRRRLPRPRPRRRPGPGREQRPRTPAGRERRTRTPAGREQRTRTPSRTGTADPDPSRAGTADPDPARSAVPPARPGRTRARAWPR